MSKLLLAPLTVLLLPIPQLPGFGSSPAPRELNLFVRGVLEDRFVVEGYPDQRVFGTSKQIDIQREVGESFYLLGREALPHVAGYTFTLRDRAYLEQQAASSDRGVHFVEVSRALILSDNEGTIVLGMGFIPPAGHIALCCCSKTGMFRRVERSWRLQDWLEVSCH
jgi:hypothetical protein